jgi:L-threonylcarbamoyladenylate synthase
VKVVDDKRAGELLCGGAVGIIPTESVYGIVASAFDEAAVNRVYNLKQRTPSKPCIVLISKPEEMLLFDIAPDTINNASLYWPAKVSVVVPCLNKQFFYITRDTATLAFRVPAHTQLQTILQHSGPIIAPSANPESKKPATTIKEAYEYFGETVDFYTDGGVCNSKPSKVIDSISGHIFRK